MVISGAMLVRLLLVLIAIVIYHHHTRDTIGVLIWMLLYLGWEKYRYEVE